MSINGDLNFDETVHNTRVHITSDASKTGPGFQRMCSNYKKKKKKKTQTEIGNKTNYYQANGSCTFFFREENGQWRTGRGINLWVGTTKVH
jgi:hypothetical protein